MNKVHALKLFVGEGNGNPLQYSCLENPTDGGAWWATVHGVAKSRTWLSDLTSLCLFGKERKLIVSQTRFRSAPFFRFRWRSLLHFAEDRSFWGRTLLLPGFRWVNKHYNPKTVPCVLMNISASFRTLPSKACALSKYHTVWWASSWQAATFTRG